MNGFTPPKKTLRTLALALFLTACAGLLSPDQAPLEGTSWRLTEQAGKPPLPERVATIRFLKGMADGSTGCNTFHGNYQVNGDGLAFRDLAVTEMACLEPEGIMEKESALMNTLWNAQSFQIQGDRLKILSSEGETLTFKRMHQPSR